MHFATTVVVSLFALTAAAAPLNLHARQERRLAVVRRGDEDESYTGKSCRLDHLNTTATSGLSI